MSGLPETAESTSRSSRVKCTGHSKQSQVSLGSSAGDGRCCPVGGFSDLDLAVSPACGSAGPRRCVSTRHAVCSHRPPLSSRSLSPHVIPSLVGSGVIVVLPTGFSTF